MIDEIFDNLKREADSIYDNESDVDEAKDLITEILFEIIGIRKGEDGGIVAEDTDLYKQIDRARAKGFNL